MSQRFPQGKNAVNVRYDRGFMDLTDVMVLRDLCDELLAVNEVHVEIIE